MMCVDAPSLRRPKDLCRPLKNYIAGTNLMSRLVSFELYLSSTVNALFSELDGRLFADWIDIR